MFTTLLLLISLFFVIHGRHFNGGTISWAPVNPYNNGSFVDITVTQTYSWTYPYVKCANNVPISTPTFSGANTNVSCVVDCSTDGGYNNTQVDILTNCTSASSAMKMMTSQGTKKITLGADAHFYIAYRGSAWVGLNSPAQTGLEWSIVAFIDLRKRSDGFINTPPVAQYVSPQYAFVNKTIQIKIPVSDVNSGDDVRCRWSRFTSGYRRRKRFDEEENLKQPTDIHVYSTRASTEPTIHIKKRAPSGGSCGGGCGGSCIIGCACSCSGCNSGAGCPGICDGGGICSASTTTTTVRTATTTTTARTATTTTTVRTATTTTTARTATTTTTVRTATTTTTARTATTTTTARTATTTTTTKTTTATTTTTATSAATTTTTTTATSAATTTTTTTATSAATTTTTTTATSAATTTTTTTATSAATTTTTTTATSAATTTTTTTATSAATTTTTTTATSAATTTTTTTATSAATTTTTTTATSAATTTTTTTATSAATTTTTTTATSAATTTTTTTATSAATTTTTTTATSAATTTTTTTATSAATTTTTTTATSAATTTTTTTATSAATTTTTTTAAVTAASTASTTTTTTTTATSAATTTTTTTAAVTAASTASTTTTTITDTTTTNTTAAAAVTTTATTSTTTTTSITMTTSTATTITDTTTTTTTTESTTTESTTTLETLGTLKSTSTYPIRQAIDECADICYPGGLPSTTTLSGCTISFTGVKAGVWYAIAIQVEDFINSTSMTPMSSVPVQLLIYVQPQPACSDAPLIFPLDRCLEVQVGVSISFNISVMNLCNSNVAKLADMVITSAISGMSHSNLTSLSTNTSVSYVKYTWTPQINQIGAQMLCVYASTTENLQSDPYCVSFTVKNSTDLCVTTTKTSTSTTSVTSTTTTATTTTTSTSTTSETTTTTSETTTTETTSSSSTSSTSSTSTSSTSTSSTTTTTTSTTTTSTTTSTTTTTTTSTTTTTTSTTTTSTTTTTTTTSTTSTTTTTTTSTTSTTSTTTTVTTTTTTTATTTKSPDSSMNWLLILGLSLLALLLAICCACCCLYRLLWLPGARRRRRNNSNNKDDFVERPINTKLFNDKLRRKPLVRKMFKSELPTKDGRTLSDVRPFADSNNTSPSDLRVRLTDSNYLEASTNMTNVDGRKISSTVSIKRVKRAEIDPINNNKSLNENRNETENLNTESPNNLIKNDLNRNIQRSTVSVVRISKSSGENLRNSILSQPSESKTTVSSTTPRKSEVRVTRIPRNNSVIHQKMRATSIDNISTIDLDKNTIKIKPMRNKSMTNSLLPKMEHVPKSNSVAVTKISRMQHVSRSNSVAVTKTPKVQHVPRSSSVTVRKIARKSFVSPLYPS